MAMMKRANGATLAEITEATGWQKHIVRGFVSILGSAALPHRKVAGRRHSRSSNAASGSVPELGGQVHEHVELLKCVANPGQDRGLQTRWGMKGSARKRGRIVEALHRRDLDM